MSKLVGHTEAGNPSGSSIKTITAASGDAQPISHVMHSTSDDTTFPMRPDPNCRVDDQPQSGAHEP